MRKKLIALLTCIAMIIAFSPAVFADDSSDAVISPAPQADWQTAYNIYFANKIENCDFYTTGLKMAAKDINNDGIPEVFVNWRPHKLNVYTYADGKVKALVLLGKTATKIKEAAEKSKIAVSVCTAICRNKKIGIVKIRCVDRYKFDLYRPL